MGREELLRGSGKPKLICMPLVADRYMYMYVLIVCGAKSRLATCKYTN